MKSLTAFFMVCWLCLFPGARAAVSKEVRIQLKWLHQAQFAGCYVALEKGFYRERGLEVTLLEGGPGQNPTQVLLEGRAEFALSSPEDLLMHRSRGEQARAVAAIYRKSAVVFLSKEDSGILQPVDFEGKVIAVESSRGISDFKLQFDALMRNLQVDRSGMTLVPYDPEYQGFLNQEVDITPAYFTGGLIKLRQREVRVNIIYPGDYRVRFYSDILMATDRLIAQDPDLVFQVVSATLKGWKFAIDHIDQSVPMILKYARIKEADLQEKMLAAGVPLVNTGINHLGWMTREEWQHMYQILLDQHLLSGPVKDLDTVFTNRFVEKSVSGTTP